MLNDELKKMRDELAGRFVPHSNIATSEIRVRDAYLRGFNAAEPLIRADERSRILGLFKSGEANSQHRTWEKDVIVFGNAIARPTNWAH